MNKKKIFRIVNYVLSLAVVAITTTVIVSLFLKTDISEKSTFRATTSSYKTSQFEIKDSEHALTDAYTPISSFYTFNNNVPTLNNSRDDTTNPKITISNAIDLYMFSVLLNTDSKFLDNYYLLLNNIDYSELTYGFLPIGYNGTSEFRGTFDGNGYDINSLNFVTIDSTINNESALNKTPFYSMFCQNGNEGTIKNFGLIDPRLTSNVYLESITAVAPVVGLNKGNVSNVYVKILGNPEDEIGISTAGQYVIAGFCYTNEGTISNSYVAYDIVVNFTVKDYISFCEFVDVNAGEVSNCYFYNGTIVNYQENGSTATAEYDNGLIGKNVTRTVVKGLTWTNSLTSLMNSFTLDNGYFTSSYYTNTDVRNAINLDTPVLRGLEAYDTSGLAFTVNSEKDFIYLYELMNKNLFFASNRLSYYIKNDLDLSIYDPSFYSYNSFISASFIGCELSGTVSNIVEAKSVYPTIYGASLLNNAYVSGIESYGLFPLFSGKIENINLYNENEYSSFNDSSSISNFKAIGSLVGYSEGSTINNVNIYNKYKLSSPNNNFGKYYAGGLLGIATSNTTISNITVAGSIDGGTHNTYTDSSSGYLAGNCLGGIVGYAANGGLNMDTCLSAVTLTATTYTSNFASTQAVGGVLGGGYTTKVDKITNKGNINVGSSSSTYYGSMYVSGVFGRIIGVYEQLFNIHNQGDINIYFNDYDNYVSGVMNVDLLTSATSGLSASTYKTRKGLSLFEASSVTNCSDITINGSSNNNYYAGVIYLKSNNGFTTNLSGIYNIGYKYVIKSTNKSSYSNQKVSSDIEIDMNLIKEYAPVVVNDSNNTTYSVTLSTVYNLRNVNFTANTTFNSTSLEFKYFGVLSGLNYNATNVRNEGNLTFNINNRVTVGNIIIAGVLEEISNGFNGTTLINSGNINFYTKTNVSGSSYTYFKGNLNISGICYANRNVITDDSYNPLNNDYSSDNVGSINDTINNGNITIDNIDNINLTKSYLVNGFDGNVKLGGITIYNYGIISNTFNLGDIDAYVFSPNSTTYYYEAGGITYANLGNYAQIRDTSNNGRVKVVVYQTSIQSTYTKYANSAGIVCRNDVAETGTFNATNFNQLVAFTINYGYVYAYNGYNNISSASTSSHAHASGIIGLGLANTLNCINYGNVYSSEVAGSLYAKINFSDFDSSIQSTDTITIANTLNYGNILAINKYASDGTQISVNISLDILQQIDENYDSIYVGMGQLVYNQYIGALFGSIDFDNSSKVNNLVIRYLINFCDNTIICPIQLNIPSNNVDLSTFSTVYGTNRTFLGNNVVYAALATIDDGVNIGVFSENFMFRRAIAGDSRYVDIEKYISDSYIGDFFSFIAYTKVNDYLIDSIGWKTLAYMEATERLGRDLNALVELVEQYNKKNSTSYATLVEKVLADTSWLANADVNNLSLILQELLENQSTDKLKEIIQALFSSSYSSSITVEIKNDIIDSVFNYLNYDRDGLLTVLDSLFTSEVFTNALIGTSENYNNLLSLIKTDISKMTTEQLADLTNTYLEILENNPDIIAAFYNADYNSLYSKPIADTVDALISGLPEEVLTDILGLFADTDINADNVVAVSIILEKLQDDDREKILTSLISNNTVESMSTELTTLFTMFNMTDYINSIVNNSADDTFTANLNAQYAGTTYTNEYRKDRSNASLTTNTEYQSNVTNLNFKPSNIDYSNLWNLIKNDSVITNYLENNLGYVTGLTGSVSTTNKGIYALATEKRSSYQSNDAPAKYSMEGVINTTGVMRTESATAKIKNRFIRTPDEIVSDITYYYGPFQQPDGKYLQTNFTGNSLNYNQGLSLSTTDNTTTSSSTRYVPMTLTLEEAYAQQISSGSAGGYTEFIYNSVASGLTLNGDTGEVLPSQGGDSACQYVTKTILDNRPNDSSIALFMDDTKTYGYDFENAGLATAADEYKLKLYPYANNDYFVYGPDTIDINKNQNTTEILIQEHLKRNQYLTIYGTTAVISGLWCILDTWYQGEIVGNFLTSKTSNNVNGYQGVLTTSFIDYSVSDLVNLDGILTNGNGNNAESTDEKAIINVLIQYLLNTGDGRKAIMTAISNSTQSGSIFTVNTSTSDVTCKDSNALTALLNTLNGTSYVDDSNTTNSFSNVFLSNLIYFPNSKNLNGDATNKLWSYIYTPDVIFTNEEKIKILVSDSTNGRSKLIILLNYLYDKDVGFYSYLQQTGMINELVRLLEGSESVDYNSITSYIYTYLENNYSQEQIDTILSGTSIETIREFANANANLEAVLDDTTLGNITYSNVPVVFSPHTYNGNTYMYALQGSDTSSTMRINSGTCDILNILFNGTISINGTEYTSNGESVVEVGIVKNDINTINISSGSSIYDLDFVSKKENTLNLSGFDVSSRWYEKTTYTITIPAMTSPTVKIRNILPGDNTKAYQITQGSNTIVSRTNITAGDVHTLKLSNETTEKLDFLLTSYNTQGAIYIDSIDFGVLSLDRAYEDGDLTSHLSELSDPDLVDTIYTLNHPITSTIVFELTSENDSITLNRETQTGLNPETQKGSTVTFENVTPGTTFTHSEYTNNTTDKKVINSIKYYTNEEPSEGISEVTEEYGKIISQNNDKYLNLNYSDNELDNTIISNLNNSSRETYNSLPLEFTMRENGMIYVYATGSGNIALSNGQNHNVSNSASNLYVFSANAGDYTFTTTGTVSVSKVVIIYDGYSYTVNDTGISYTGATSDTVYSGNYAAISACNETIKNKFKTYATLKEVQNKYDFFKNKSVSFTDFKERYEALILMLSSTNETYRNFYDYMISDTDYLLSDEDLLTLIKAISVTNNVSINTVINEIKNDSSTTDEEKLLIDTISTLVQNVSELITVVFSEADVSSATLTDSLKNKFTALYVGTDYIQNFSSSPKSLTQSELYDILDILGKDYQFITSDTDIDTTKFDNLANLLPSFNQVTEGYGIYALSSSKGILNGQFIPDNISLESMNANYRVETEGTDSFYVITDETTDAWMQNGIYTKVTEEMKQLKKSIATTVFEIVLTDGTNFIYTSAELIGTDRIEIYIPSGYTNEFYIHSYIISDKATFVDYENFRIRLNGSTGTSSFVVVAEDTEVSTEYTLELIGTGEIYHNLVSIVGNETTLNNVPQVSASNGTLNIVLETNLPVGFDFTPYITLLDDLDSVNYSYIDNPYVYYYNETTNRVNINLNISEQLPGGTNTIKVQVYSTTALELVFNKKLNTGAVISNLEFDGQNVSFTYNSTLRAYVATTNIDFGRIFMDENFILNSNDFYLSDFEYSPGANIDINISYLLDGAKVSTKVFENGIVTYQVTFTITSEDGNTTNVYIHNLTEKSPFDLDSTSDDGKFSSTYVAVSNEGTRVEADLTGNDDDINAVKVDFNRDNSASFRFDYTFANFYYSSVISNYLSIDGSNYTINNSGVVINFDSTTEPGTYTYNLVYQYEVLGYTRIYTLPQIVIVCNYSTDSLLESITFYESASVLSSIATVVSSTVLKPEGDVVSADGEKLYQEYLASNNKEIDVINSTIRYGEYSTLKNFYIVGSVSGAQLVDYAPIFSINNHALIYQYTTEKKIKGYGSNVSQSETDKTVLETETNEKLYLYVPYTYINNEGYVVTEIFIVEYQSGIYGNVYTIDIQGAGAEFESKKTECKVLDYSSSTMLESFEYNGLTYTLSENAGSTRDNSSLYMDYIGTPADNHFWYVSYVILSEDAAKTSSTNLQFYHVALIDATNTIYFNISLKLGDGVDLEIGSIYLNIVDIVTTQDASNNDITTNHNISTFLDINEDGTYSNHTSLQVLPSGNFYFYLSIPEGYTTKYTALSPSANSDKDNTYTGEDEHIYNAPPSIVTQTINIEITIENSDAGIIWGVGNPNTYYVNCSTYDGKYKN